MTDELLTADRPERNMDDIPTPSAGDLNRIVNGMGVADKVVPPIELLESIVYGPRRGDGLHNDLNYRMGLTAIEALLEEPGLFT